MSSGIRYVFFGTPRIAAEVLKELRARNMLPVALVSNPDRPSGRKGILTPPPTKQFILQNKLEEKIKIFQPEKILQIEAELKNLRSDYFIIAAYSKILPARIMEIPARGVIGFHPSLLPKYRGPSPFQTALLEGEKDMGASLYLLDSEIDHGPILLQKKLKPYDPLIADYLGVETRLAKLGGEMIADFLHGGDNQPKPQNDALATFTRKFTSEDAFVDPRELARAVRGDNADLALKILLKIRALNPEPGVWTRMSPKNLRLKLLEAELLDNGLKLVSVQREGRKPESGHDLAFEI